MTELYSDNYYMGLALAEARAAAAEDEIPIGAVVVGGGRVLGRGHNQTERLCDVTAHAEMLALSAAAQALGGKYLSGCTLYVTVEPCPMCAGAIGWSQHYPAARSHSLSPESRSRDGRARGRVPRHNAGFLSAQACKTV